MSKGASHSLQKVAAQAGESLAHAASVPKEFIYHKKEKIPVIFKEEVTALVNKTVLYF
jgi:hypothetical protein